MGSPQEETFESRIKRLEEIVQALESPDVSLESGLELYREGMTCVRFCRGKLESAKHQIEAWNGSDVVEAELSDGGDPAPF